MTTITRMSKTRKTSSARRISEGPIILFSRGKVLRSIPEYYRSLFEPYVWQGRCERTPVRGFVPPSLPVETLAATSSSSSSPGSWVAKLASQTDIRRRACTVSPRRGWQAEGEKAVGPGRGWAAFVDRIRPLAPAWQRLGHSGLIIVIISSLSSVNPLSALLLRAPRYRNDTDSNWPETCTAILSRRWKIISTDAFDGSTRFDDDASTTLVYIQINRVE